MINSDGTTHPHIYHDSNGNSLTEGQHTNTGTTHLQRTTHLHGHHDREGATNLCRNNTRAQKQPTYRG